MYMTYATTTDDDDDEASAEVHIRMMINGIWTERRGSNKNDKKSHTSFRI
jgi:hypothetical protein